MACGDGNNDFEMVKMAGVGVAMENGDCLLYTSKELFFSAYDSSKRRILYMVRICIRADNAYQKI